GYASILRLSGQARIRSNPVRSRIRQNAGQRGFNPHSGECGYEVILAWPLTILSELSPVISGLVKGADPGVELSERLVCGPMIRVLFEGLVEIMEGVLLLAQAEIDVGQLVTEVRRDRPFLADSLGQL